MAAALAIGTIKAVIVAAVFMELRHRGARTLVFAAAGLFWLAILLWLGAMIHPNLNGVSATGSDYPVGAPPSSSGTIPEPGVFSDAGWPAADG
jgi:hypothetical protein